MTPNSNTSSPSFAPAASYLLGVLSHVRLFHWNTTSFAQHKALGEFYDYLDGWMDNVVESWMGVYKVPIQLVEWKCEFSDPVELLFNLREWLALDFPGYVGNQASFLNERDSLVLQINKLLYLLRLS